MVRKSQYRYDTEASEFAKIIQALRRRFWYIFGVVALVTGAAAYVGSQQQPTYTASAQIVLEPDDGTNSINDFVADSLSKDRSAIETQIKLLRTHNHVMEVITSLNLEERWAGATIADGDGGRAANEGSDWPADPPTPKNQSDVSAEGETPMAALYRRFNSNYRVQQERQSYVISIYYTSEDPAEAAEIANRAADVFIESKRSEKLGVTDRASQWLSKRAQSLHHELMSIEDDIAQFRDENPVNARQDPGSNNEIEFLLSELASVRAEISSKVATLALAQKTQSGQGDLRGIAEIDTSPILQNLLGEQLALLAREAELGRSYGDSHPLMVQHKAEQERLDIKVDQEIARIVASIENDVGILTARRDSLEQEVDELRKQEAGKAKATLQLEGLLRRAESTRELYRTVQQRSKEISEQQEMVEPDVHLVSRAAIPTTPRSPGAKTYAAIGFTASTIMSIMLVLFLDRNDKRLRTPGQIKE